MDLQFNVPSLLGQFNQFLGVNEAQPEVRMRSPQADLVMIESPYLVYLNDAVVREFSRDSGGEILAIYVLLHEWYHYIRHDIRSFSEAIQTIEVFGERPLYEFDIEVDVTVFFFLHEALGFQFKDYLEKVFYYLLLFFPVTPSRTVKIERHFGSLWSIVHSHQNDGQLMIPSLAEYFQESDVLVHVPVRQYAPVRKIHRLGLIRSDLDLWISMLIEPGNDPVRFAENMTALAHAFPRNRVTQSV